MSEDIKKSTIQIPRRSEAQGAGRPRESIRKPEAAISQETEDFLQGWSPWRDLEQSLNLPPSIRDWEPEPRSSKRRASTRRSTGRGSQGRRRQSAASRRVRQQERQEDSGRPSSIYQTIAQQKLRLRRRWRRIVRENKAHRFPESERLPVQLLLFFWGLLPMWGSLFQEAVLQKNRASRQKSAQSAQKKHWRVHPAVFLLGGSALAVILLFFSTYTNGITVTYDGKVLGSLSNEAEAEAARTELEKITAQTLGRTFTIDDSDRKSVV